MANNLLKTFPLTGGEDAVSSSLQIPDGTARTLYNYEQNYDTGYRRIDGYRQLVSGPLPGYGSVRGLVVYNNHIYLFQDKANGGNPPTEGGMWRATADIYKIGSEADGDDQSLWGVNILLTAGQWDEIDEIKSPIPTIENKKEINPIYKITIDPIKGTAKNVVAAKKITLASIVLMIKGGIVFPMIKTLGDNGDTSVWSKVPSSRSLATDREVRSKAMIIDKLPIRFGSIHQKLSKLGLYQFLLMKVSLFIFTVCVTLESAICT